MCTSSVENRVKKGIRNPLGLKIGAQVGEKLYNDGKGTAKLYRTDTYEKPKKKNKGNN
jgi:hypothetical protein|tara:strand:+ start:360 stop:533 length:174 start_codon:yes stop_codon:yes gene_type:complete